MVIGKEIFVQFAYDMCMYKCTWTCMWIRENGEDTCMYTCVPICKIHIDISIINTVHWKSKNDAQLAMRTLII